MDMLEGLMLTSGHVNDDDGDIALATDFYELTMAAAYHDALIETHPSSDYTKKRREYLKCLSGDFHYTDHT